MRSLYHTPAKHATAVPELTEEQKAEIGEAFDLFDTGKRDKFPIAHHSNTIIQMDRALLMPGS